MTDDYSNTVIETDSVSMALFVYIIFYKKVIKPNLSKVLKPKEKTGFLERVNMQPTTRENLDCSRQNLVVVE